jgi:enamine deaminase RidA (YjgF/YER057c/UK114 family)
MNERHHADIRILALGLVFVAALPESIVPADDSIRFIEPREDEGCSAAVVVPDLWLGHTAQFLSLDAQGKLVGTGNVEVQVAAVLTQLESAAGLAEPTASGSPQLVKLHVVATDEAVAATIRKALAKRSAGDKPAVTFVVGKLRVPDALLAMDAVFAHAKAPSNLVVSKSSNRRPALAVLPPGPKVYISGQAEKGKDLAEMTRRTMESLAATLEHIGVRLKDVVQVKSFVGPFAEVDVAENEIVGFFKDQPVVPPLVFVEWTTAPSIEIELIASAASAGKQATESVEFITPPGMTASPVFSRVALMAAGPSIYISGLYGTSQGNGAAETREIFQQLGSLLEQSGSDFRHLVKATYYVSTNEASTKLNEIRPEFYDPKRPPAASKAPVTGTGRAGGTITLDMIAAPKSI